MSTLAVAERQSDLLASLRRLKGRGTVGDVVADSGLPADAVRDGLRSLLESHRGHLEVADSGELVYDFDPKLIERGSEPLLARIRRTATKVITGGFKAWIVVMLVVYFVVFVVLVVAAILGNQRGNDSRGGWGGGRRGSRGGLPFDPLLWYWIWSPRWRIGRPYYGHRWERTLGKNDKVPFYKKVFAFVFGPDRPKPTTKQLDRAKLRLIRARNGVVTTAELVEHTGSSFDDGEEDMGRLLGAYEGEAVVSPDGELVYAFPGLMASVEGRSVRPPNPAWLRLEPKRELTGNTAGANAVVAGMNAFTMIAAATAPWFIFPRLGLGGPAAFFGLVLVPLVFSVLFFAGPALRMIGVTIENGRRMRRNVYRVLLGHVYEEALAGRPVNTRRAAEHVASRMRASGEVDPAKEVERHLRTLATELEAEVSVEQDGSTTYRFDSIRDQFSASETVRTKLRLEKRELGDVVFSTADSPEAASERELALFDREVLERGVDLGRYLPSTDRIDFEEDYAVVAFEEELGRGR